LENYEKKFCLLLVSQWVRLDARLFGVLAHYSYNRYTAARSSRGGLSFRHANSLFLDFPKGFYERLACKTKKLRVSIFFVSSLLGLSSTYFLSSLYINAFGEHVHGAKLFAVFFSFLLVYWFRKVFVFASPKPVNND
jgi:hypothetical protein